MSDSRNLFLFSRGKMARKIRGGGGQIYWTYSLLVPKGRHRELALKKVKIVMTLSLTVLSATISELFPPSFVFVFFVFSDSSPGLLFWRHRARDRSRVEGRESE